MNNDIEQPNKSGNVKAMAGIILLFVGGILLLKQFRIFFLPDDIVLWPLWIIGWGLFVGAKSNFHKPSSFALIFIGGVLLIGNNIPGGGEFIWPMALIAFGLWMILRRHNRFDKDYVKMNADKWDWKNGAGPVKTADANEPIVDYTVPPEGAPKEQAYYAPTGDDYLDTVSVFGGVKKTILSKNFKGGEIVNVFGGAELDFIQADIQGRVIIDITQIFGGTKIIVPSNWQVVSDIAAVFAGIDDKRIKSTTATGSEKILVLKGVSIFAGVDIRSY